MNEGIYNLKLILVLAATAAAAVPGGVSARRLRGAIGHGAEASSLHEAMVPLIWDENNAATIEFCQEGESTFGYRLPGGKRCGAAGVLIKVTPGQDYELTVHNAANETTNIHTHGVHISGDGNADDVTRVVDPGNCLTYYYSIPSDHMGGTHWIHSHNHGATKQQVTGGAFSLLTIEETDDILDNVEDANDRENIQKWMDNELFLATYEAGDSYAVNGRDSVVLNLVDNEWYRLRMLTVQASGKRVPVSFPDECEVHLAASDGVWSFETPNTEIQRDLSPTGSGRTDLAIRCVAGEYGVAIGPNADQIVTLNVAEGSTSTASPFLGDGGAWTPMRPYYLRDLTNGDDNVGDFEPYHIFLDQRTINGYSYDEETQIEEIQYNTLQEWTIEGSGVHPFHLHVYHMQTFNCDGHIDGEHYDSIVADNDDCRVHFHFIDFSGRTTIHCHNVGHEDQGMMVWMDVVNGTDKIDYYDRDQKICPAFES